MNGRPFLLTFLVFTLIGCDGGSKTSVDSTTPKPADSGSPKTDQSADSKVETKAPEPAAPKLADIPETLRHAAFEWYGLSNDKPLKMTLTQAGTKMTGSQHMDLQSIKDGVAIFKQSWDGDLTPYGDSLYKVDAKGIYGIEAQGTKVDPPSMELPANPTPGTAWQSDAKIEVAGSKVKSTSSKIVGTKTIKLGGRTVEVLVVHRVSLLSVAEKDQTMDATEYYEKGVGTIKLEVKMISKGEPTRSFVMEANP